MPGESHGDGGVRKKFTAVGAYIFAGGFTLGVRRAGFRVLAHLEGSDYGVATARHNMPWLPVHVGEGAWPLADLEGKVDFVYGNPPCAAWSAAGYSKTRGSEKWRTDPRVACTESHFGLLEILKPRVWAWESVTQAFTKGREFVDGLAQKAMALGYSVTHLLHDAQYLGLPQVRKRYFMVCHRVEFTPAEPNWGGSITPAGTLEGVHPGEPFVAGGQLIKTFHSGVLAQVKPGQRLSDFWERNLAGSGSPTDWPRNSSGGVRGRPAFGLVRLPADKPSGAVVGYMMVHPTEDRWLSTEEMQVLSGFPESFCFTPRSAAERAHEIARGVCPPVGEWLATAVSRSLSADLEVTDPVETVVDLRKPPLRPATTRSMTVKVQSVTPVTAAVTDTVTDEAPLTQEGGRSFTPGGKKPNDFDRRYDQTQLTDRSHGHRVHRDYAAHYFRWGFAFSRVEYMKTRVLDVGCGQDCPLARVLSNHQSAVPALYVGVDLNKISAKPGFSWCQILDRFDFIEQHAELASEHGGHSFDLAVCFEVIEHMHPPDGLRLLLNVADLVRPGGEFLLSTPVYNGRKMAANHLHEYGVDELRFLIRESGKWDVRDRFGTFASWNEIKKEISDGERELVEELHRYYDHEVLSCFLAPKYPDASRNNVWRLVRRSDDA